MGKKRRVWWIVGALVVAVALFAALTFVVGYNSTDAKIDRAVAQIVEKYGFEVQDQTGTPSKAVITEVYSRAPVDTETAIKIVAILREGCPSCTYEYGVFDEDDLPVTASGGDPWWETHGFSQDLRDGGFTEGVGFIPDYKGSVRPGTVPGASLVVFKFVRPSLWQRITGTSPW